VKKTSYKNQLSTRQLNDESLEKYGRNLTQ